MLTKDQFKQGNSGDRINHFYTKHRIFRTLMFLINDFNNKSKIKSKRKISKKIIWPHLKTLESLYESQKPKKEISKITKITNKI